MSNEEIKAEIVKALQGGENNYARLLVGMYNFGIDENEFQKALNQLIDCDRVTELEDGYLHLNY